MNKSSFESYMTEVGMTLGELSYVIKHLRSWVKTEKVVSPLAQFHSKSFVVTEPYGVTLVMSPWNFPLLLCLEPLVGAIAAGNCCVLKPSAYSPATSTLIFDLIKETFIPEYVTVIEGGREANSTLLEQRFDYIFFTGGVTVGKIVMEKASKNLTPVTLELGGKSPCIVDETANLNLAAKRLVFGKYLNGGQTCIAPDYLLVQASVKEEFLQYVSKWIVQMFGEKPLENPDYPKMINKKHYDRVMNLIKGEDILVGGKGNEDTLHIVPTVLHNITGDSPIMQEEIFGPVLPVLTFHTIEEAESFVQLREKPLALYLFTTDRQVEKRILNNVSFGGGCINDTIIHIATSRMGFGGVGGSGMGSYHGRLSFETFSHKKSIVKKYNWIDLAIRYQPYNETKSKFIRMFLK
jgi:aldehyde dehydrogenase (NAD+)